MADDRTPQGTQRVLQRIRQTERPLDASAFRDRSHREIAVLLLVSQGKSNREIAEVVGLSEKTVRNHESNLLEKLSKSSRIELAALRKTGHLTVPGLFV